MIDWWQGLVRREQILVACAGIVLVGGLMFVFVLEPLAKEQAALDRRLTAERGALERIQQYTGEAQGIITRVAASEGAEIDRSQSLLSVLNKTAAKHSLQTKLKRIVPSGADQASVVFEAVAFDGLSAWLVELQTNYGVVVDRITVDKEQDQGLVRANVNLNR
ncbi:MAG: type II secretion system protein M [Pseudomonadota bacterium]